ncbi:MAG: lipopolysaccharide biosynthesis protein [Pseudomonadales bacterium]|nr:lipopolysaccharide biosynthesis protein [Pseudomonadales bacterium]
MENLHGSIKKGLLWGGGVTALNAFIQLSVLALLARFLTPSEFGLVGLGNIVTAFSMLVLEMGVAAAITQRESLDDEHKGSAHAISMLMSVIVGGAIIIFGASIARFFDAEELKDILPIYAVILIVRGMGVIAQGLVLRELKFKELNLIEFSSYLFGYGLFGVSLAFFGFGVWALVLAYLAQSIIKTVLMNISVGSKRDWALTARGVSEIMSFGVGDTVGQTANFFANQLDNILIGKLLGVSALGIYGRAYQISVMPVNLIGGVIQKTLFPVFSRAKGKALKGHVIPWLRFAFFVGCFLSVSVALWAEEIVLIVLGEQWVSYSKTFSILSYGILFRLLMKFSDSLLRSQGRLYIRAVVQIFYASGVFAAIMMAQGSGLNAVCFSILSVLIVTTGINLYFASSSATLTWVEFVSILFAPVAALLICAIAYVGVDQVAFTNNIANLVLYGMISLICIGFYTVIIQRFSIGSSTYV